VSKGFVTISRPCGIGMRSATSSPVPNATPLHKSGTDAAHASRRSWCRRRVGWGLRACNAPLPLLLQQPAYASFAGKQSGLNTFLAQVARKSIRNETRPEETHERRQGDE
jgi:hypothetical protein